MTFQFMKRNLVSWTWILSTVTNRKCLSFHTTSTSFVVTTTSTPKKLDKTVTKDSIRNFFSFNTVLFADTSSSSSNNNTYQNHENNNNIRNSVTGNIYDILEEHKDMIDNYPKVQLYTKEGCTLCDKVVDVLRSLRGEVPHSLDAIDITDEDKKETYDRYKWDIPVLHINGKYWTKHSLEKVDAIETLSEIRRLGFFEGRQGEPNAMLMELRAKERENK